MCCGRGRLSCARRGLAASAATRQAPPLTSEPMRNFVGSWIGVRRLLGLEAWRATFRPDLPTIDRVVESK